MYLVSKDQYDKLTRNKSVAVSGGEGVGIGGDAHDSPVNNFEVSDGGTVVISKGGPAALPTPIQHPPAAPQSGCLGKGGKNKRKRNATPFPRRGKSGNSTSFSPTQPPSYTPHIPPSHSGGRGPSVLGVGENGGGSARSRISSWSRPRTTSMNSIQSTIPPSSSISMMDVDSEKKSRIMSAAKASLRRSSMLNNAASFSGDPELTKVVRDRLSVLQGGGEIPPAPPNTPTARSVASQENIERRMIHELRDAAGGVGRRSPLTAVRGSGFVRPGSKRLPVTAPTRGCSKRGPASSSGRPSPRKASRLRGPSPPPPPPPPPPSPASVKGNARRAERWLARHPSSVPPKKCVELAVLGQKRPRPWVARVPPAKRYQLIKNNIEDGVLELLESNVNTPEAKRARQDLEALLDMPAPPTAAN